MPERAIGDHYPIMLSIPAEVDPAIPSDRRYAADDLTDEQWMDHNTELASLIEEEKLSLSRHFEANNPHHFCVPMEPMVTRVPSEPRMDQNPMSSFLHSRKKRSEIAILSDFEKL